MTDRAQRLGGADLQGQAGVGGHDRPRRTNVAVRVAR